MQGSKKEPRRSVPRVNIRSNQIAYLNFHSGNGGIVLDVSRNGLGFQAVEPLKPNESLPFRLSVPGFPHINLSGHVVWVDQSRKRGGLRIIVPQAERRAFQLWQQYLGPQLQGDESAADMRGPDMPERQLDAKRFRISRNVLVGFLLVVLCVALADGSQFLSAVRHIGNLLSPPDRTFGAMPQAVSASLHTTTLPERDAPVAVASRALPSRSTDRRPSKSYDPGPLPRTASPAQAAKLQSAVDSTGVEPSIAPSRPVPAPAQLIAKVPTGSANRLAGETGRNPDSLRHPANARSMRLASSTHPQPHPPALSGSMSSPDTSGIIAVSHRIAGDKLAMDAGSQAPLSPAAFQALASAAQAPPAPSLPAAEPATTFEPCQLLSSVQPAYPKDARKQKIQGEVKMRVVVGTDGTVKNVAPLGGPPPLVPAAVDATRQFHYKPALLNGKPIETIQTVDISFKLDR
jgi:TonB family protein